MQMTPSSIYHKNPTKPTDWLNSKPVLKISNVDMWMTSSSLLHISD